MSLDPRRKEAWLREFRLNGFVILRGFLPVDLVRGMYDALEPILRAEHVKWEKGESKTVRGPARFAFDISRYVELLGGPLKDERFRNHPVIEELVTEIFENRPWTRGWTQVECPWRGSAHMGWHSDQPPEDTPRPDEPNRTIRVTYNIPLVDFTWANGAMELLPGSHLQPRSFLSSALLDVEHLYPVSLRLQRGDAVLRDGNTLHRGTPNLTDRPRPMLDQTYRLEP